MNNPLSLHLKKRVMERRINQKILTLKWSAVEDDWAVVMEELLYCMDLHENMLDGNITSEENEMHRDRIRVMSYLYERMKKIQNKKLV
jgi:hypothetical protein